MPLISHISYEVGRKNEIGLGSAMLPLLRGQDDDKTVDFGQVGMRQGLTVYSCLPSLEETTGLKTRDNASRVKRGRLERDEGGSSERDERRPEAVVESVTREDTVSSNTVNEAGLDENRR